MADVINRSTLEFRRSVHAPDFPAATWKHAPDMSAVVGVERRYWKAPPDWDAEGAGPVAMSQGEQDAVDAALLDARRDAVAGQLDQVEDIMRAFALVLLDEINALRAQHSLAARTVGQLKTALRSKLGS